MAFARKVWHLLVAIKDGLVLVFMLLFFMALYAALSVRPGPARLQDGALLLRLDGTVVEEPAARDLFGDFAGNSKASHQYRARDLVRAIRLAASDDHIKAVVLDLSSFAGGGLVHMQEIGAAMDAVRAAKKPVLTYAIGYEDDGLLLAAHASEVWIDPMGGAFVMGPGGHRPYFGELLRRLKINVHVYRVGTYKDFVEPYERNDQSVPAREARQAVLSALFEDWKDDIAKARPRARIAEVAANPVAFIRGAGGDTAEAARAAGLVDRIGDKVAFGERVKALAGADPVSNRPGAFAHNAMASLLAAHRPASEGESVAVVTVAGEIVDGKAGPGTAGGERITRLIDEANADGAKALVLRVDSPGGSVLASEQIRGALLRFKADGRPVVVSMANMAASGGYWVSTPANRIFAEPGTITGSIGIFAIVPSFERALSSIGVSSDGVRTTALSGQPDFLGGFTPEVDAVLQANIEHGYARFIGLVGKSRGKTPAEVDRIAQGRVWDGGTARQIGLVDQFGGLDDALAYAAQTAKLTRWHPRFYGKEADPFASLFERLSDSDDEGEQDGAGHDLAGLVNERQRDGLARALDDLGRLAGLRGAQAYCLDCPAAPAPQARGGERGWLGLTLRALGLD